MTTEDIRLHSLSFENKKMLLASDKCGCFHCEKIFHPSEIVEWVNDKNGKTAVCPYCGVDSVIQEAVDDSYILDERLLSHMSSIWFGVGE